MTNKIQTTHEQRAIAIAHNDIFLKSISLNHLSLAYSIFDSSGEQWIPGYQLTRKEKEVEGI